MKLLDPAMFERLKTQFVRSIPQAQALGIELLRLEGREVFARMPVQAAFLGDIERGFVHTGVITTLIDTLCGLAVFIAAGKPSFAATLDLRVDYLRPTVLGADVYCRAECYRLTEQVAFARATVWQHDEADPVATCLSAFMSGGALPSSSGRAS